MKTLPLLALTTSVALIAGAGAGRFILVAPEPSTPAAGETQRLVLERLSGLEREQAGLRQSLETLSLAASGSSRPAAISAADIDAAVARRLDEQNLARVETLATAQAEPAAPVEQGLDVHALFAQLIDPELSDAERMQLYERVREAGLLDQLVALLEQRATDNPHDPQMQVELGEAYIQKIFEVGDGPAAGVWAGKADLAYDAALALDERHWDARFSKAVALSFWPPIFGKQAEAIGQLETLVKQQSGQPTQPKFAQAYLSLGNLYLQSGKTEQALAVFNDGLKLFPNDAELLAKLAP
jgi:tetratricopeptide (TPR) repeat protein